MKTVYLLGAGFSKAVHPGMPLMGGLGKAVVEDLGLPKDTLDTFGGDVEAWLSHLATPQPWQDPAEVLEDEARFRRASQAVARAVADKQPANIEPDRQIWLDRLTRHWSETEAAVLTFNYDLLVEQSLTRWERFTSAPFLYPLPVVDRTRSGAGRMSSPSPPQETLPRLFKLHGSLNLLYPQVTGTHGPVVLRNKNLLDHGQYQNQKDCHLYDDLVPLIVPPTSNKAAFYANDALRVLWRGAATALGEADRLVIMGYSFPASDLQVSTMIRTKLRPDAQVVVVDIAEEVPQRVAQMLRQGDQDRQVTHVDGDDAIKDFVNSEAGTLLRWTWNRERTACVKPDVHGSEDTVPPELQTHQTFDELQTLIGQYLHLGYARTTPNTSNPRLTEVYIPAKDIPLRSALEPPMTQAPPQSLQPVPVFGEVESAPGTVGAEDTGGGGGSGGVD